MRRSSPLAERLVSDLLAVDEPKATTEHRWALVVGLSSDDEAQRLAASRQGGCVTVNLPDVQASGPICLGCGKVRGPEPQGTECSEQVPAAIRRDKAQQRLDVLPRKERRRVQVIARRRARQEK